MSKYLITQTVAQFLEIEKPVLMITHFSDHESKSLTPTYLGCQDNFPIHSLVFFFKKFNSYKSTMKILEIVFDHGFSLYLQ